MAFRYVGMNGWFETEQCFHPKAYDCADKEQFQDLYSLGYPIPSRSMVNSGWVLVNTFEDTFGNVYPEGVWTSIRKRVSSEISRSVVALASFNGKTRFFACTGVFLDFDGKCPSILTSASLVKDPYNHNKIVEGLRIEVLLPNRQCIDGTLLHYSLHYNVALVSVKNCRARYPVNLKHTIPLELDERIDTEVLAVGRIFELGTLMTTSGILTADTGNLDCSKLSYSTCEVTKAGIGGPLVDVDGNYIGINFVGLNKAFST
jgi:small nuclear ribonucleoprotein (snRNP)-like protein